METVSNAAKHTTTYWGIRNHEDARAKPIHAIKKLVVKPTLDLRVLTAPAGRSGLEASAPGSRRRSGRRGQPSFCRATGRPRAGGTKMNPGCQGHIDAVCWAS